MKKRPRQKPSNSTRTRKAPSATRKIGYPLGTTDRERRRLVLQAEILRGFTLATFRAAEIGPGMRVLDIGSGAGDVALLAAQLVGETGSVLGIDRDENNLAFAQSRAQQAGLRNVTFRRAEISAFAGKHLFDAVIGRYILLYIPDPVAAVRQLAATLRPGGIIAFVEPDFSTPVRSHPQAHIFEQTARWIYAVVGASNMHLHTAAGLGKIFVDAGLPFPHVECSPWSGGGPGSLLYEYTAETLRSLLPSAAEHGIVAAEEAQIETLAERMEREAVARGSTLIGVPVISAWTRIKHVRSTSESD